MQIFFILAMLTLFYQVRVAVQCYEQLKTDLETHVKDMDSLSGIPPECIPANYRTSLTEVLLQWESLCQTVSDRQVTAWKF